MRTTRWTVVPVVLVLLVAPAELSKPPVKTTYFGSTYSADGTDNQCTLKKESAYSQDPGGSGAGGSGSGGGVSGSVVVGYQEGGVRGLGLCVPQEGLVGSSADTKVASVPCPPAEVAPPVSVEGEAPWVSFRG